MPADDLPQTVHFGLDLTYACGYSCPYCVLPPAGKPRPVGDWLAAWQRMRQRYGRCYIYMSGGEPSVYPGFYDLVKALAALHTVDLCTNLAWQVERLVPGLSPDVFKISATFHPTQVSFEDFLAKAVAVRDYLPQRWPPKRSVYFVADPKQMDRMPEYQARFAEHGLILVPLPLMSGQHLGNDEGEKRAIAEISPNKDTSDQKLGFQLQELTPKGKLCRAGQRYALIRGDGMVDRCTRHEDRALGDFFAPDFALWPEPRPCMQEWCPFESQWLVQEETGAPR
ncbi:MAG: radical SAM protein [Elusimicrobia bacterium]|nr:radical SAM protein [Elusimicrobiota bacterium]